VTGGHAPQAVEQRDAVVGQLDALDAAVARVTPAADQALRLEGVEVVRERGPGDAHGLGHARLVVPLAGAHEDEHLPLRGGTASVGHRPLEGLRHGTRRACELQPDRHAGGRSGGHGMGAYQAFDI
jgi:hypothetical protein